MERRNLIFTPWISLPLFLAGTAAAEETPKDPDLDFIEVLGMFEGPGSKDFGPLDLAELPDDKKALKKPPSGKSAEERKKIERKGCQR
jgi:hypothetical protein